MYIIFVLYLLGSLIIFLFTGVRIHEELQGRGGLNNLRITGMGVSDDQVTREEGRGEGGGGRRSEKEEGEGSIKGD